MRLDRLLLPAALLLLASCDSGTGPSLPPTITLSTDALSLRIGEEQTLTASYQDPSGSVTPPITWQSTNDAVATVSSSGRVRGVTGGEAKVIASASGVADTAVVTVLPPVSADCGTTGLSLALGEIRDVTAAEAASLCLSGGNGSEFTVVVTDTDSLQTTVQVASTGTLTPTGPPNPDRIPGFTAFRAAAGIPRIAAAFDARMRELGHRLMRSRSALRPRAHRGDLLPGSPRFATQVGDAMTFRVDTATSPTGNPCRNPPVVHSGSVVAVGAHSIIVADNANPPGGLSSAQYQQVAATFDNQIWASDTENFGTPQDIDANGKVILIYTRAVNELTPDDSADEGYVGGYFFPGDIFPTTDCTTTNVGEMFYLLAPDPNGVVKHNVFTADEVIKSTEGTVAHEFQHLINAELRYYVTDATEFEESWLDEGLAHIAEELLFYRVSGEGPRENIDLTFLLQPGGDATLLAFNNFQTSNMGRVKSYMASPESNGPFEPNDDDLETRGAIWQFLRYAVDRKNGVDKTYWSALTHSSTVGEQNLSAALGVDLAEWLGDFAVAQYTDDAVSGVDSRFTQPSWSFRTILPKLKAQQSEPDVFPLLTRTLGHNSTISLNLSDKGGTGYLRAGVAANGVGSIKLTTSSGPIPTGVRVTVIRTK